MNNQPTTIDYPKRTWEEMKSSDHPLDRLAVYINDLSPHNLWRAREAIDYIFDERFAQAIERAKADVVVDREYRSEFDALGNEAKQAILEDLLALPVAQDEVSQKLTQSNQEWAKYAHIRNAIRQEWRKALTAYFEGEEYNCDCDFDVDPNDLTDDWHYLRICYSCGKQWYALHCPHEKIQHPCPNCGIIPDRERYLRKD